MKRGSYKNRNFKPELKLEIFNDLMMSKEQIFLKKILIFSIGFLIYIDAVWKSEMCDQEVLNLCLYSLITTAEAWENIIAAVDEIQKKSCIRFRMKKRGDRHWIRFVKKTG